MRIHTARAEFVEPDSVGGCGESGVRGHSFDNPLAAARHREGCRSTFWPKREGTWDVDALSDYERAVVVLAGLLLTNALVFAGSLGRVAGSDCERLERVIP